MSESYTVTVEFTGKVNYKIDGVASEEAAMAEAKRMAKSEGRIFSKNGSLEDVDYKVKCAHEN